MGARGAGGPGDVLSQQGETARQGQCVLAATVHGALTIPTLRA